MEEKKVQTAEEWLREVADKAGVPFRDFAARFGQAYRDDLHIKKLMQENAQADLQMMQTQLMQLQYRNETLSNQILTRKLQRQVWWINFWRTVKFWKKSENAGK